MEQVSDLVTAARLSVAISDYFQWASLKNLSRSNSDPGFILQLVGDARIAYSLSYLGHIDINAFFGAHKQRSISVNSSTGLWLSDPSQSHLFPLQRVFA